MGPTRSRPTPFAVVRHGSERLPRVDLRSLDSRLNASSLPGVANTRLIPSAASGGDAAAFRLSPASSSEVTAGEIEESVVELGFVVVLEFTASNRPYLAPPGSIPEHPLVTGRRREMCPGTRLVGGTQRRADIVG